VVALVEIYLFCGFHYDRWHKSLPSLGRPRALTGEGLVVRCDGLGYYAWLRSLLIDGDWSFDNEFDDFNVVGDYVPPPRDRTTTGRRANPWSIGPACVWAAAIAPAHLLVSFFQEQGCPWPADGYSLPYQLVVGITSLPLSILGLVFLYAICRQFADPHRAALAAALLTLSTTIIYYSAIEVSMAHGVGTVAVAALVWFWLKTYGSDSPWRWLTVGVLVGVAALMRWQLATLIVLPAGEGVTLLLNSSAGKRGEVRRRLSKMAICFLGATVAFSPQLIAWRVVYGHWWDSPITVSHNWFQPALSQVLFSQNRSLFYWTPLTLIAAVGYLLYFGPLWRQVFSLPQLQRAIGKRAPTVVGSPAVTLVPAAFILQIYMLASLWGSGVYLGVAYGFRHLTESVVLLAPGLALLVQRMPTRLYPLFAAVGCGLAFWNLLLISQYRYGLLPADSGAEPLMLLSSSLRFILRKRFILLGQVAMAPLLLWFLVGGGRKERAGMRLPCPVRSDMMVLSEVSAR
jgi:hypothetical protein